ncbi:MAG: hypothetical protein SFV55_01550 [Haliscomenobacter sp.]|uniref:hypothetical protein n=1 Tax=Haliscomenobacter sp. TaxID=2717303 RepID=UPI0029B39811|nr:hypothetical protein [Haliscomenobacter sp.]MDX2067075.1 hypothetical protein [Haliscomenobacter sp.]
MKAEPAMANWLPKRFLRQNDHDLQCEWVYLGDQRFREPFFGETLTRCLSHPFNSKPYRVVTATDLMAHSASEIPSIEPSAFIFHTSRCGSTLMTQLLSLFPQNIVVPEYAALDQLLRLPLQGFIDQHRQQKTWVKACIRLLGQIRFPEEEKLIIKLDCWHFAFFEQIAAWYPHVPKVILYRAPSESIESHLKHAGMQAVPNLLEPELFGLDRDRVAQMNQLEYLNHIFEAMYGQIQSIVQKYPNTLLLDYADGVQNMATQLTHHLQLNPNAATRLQLAERLKYHSKRNSEVFEEHQAPTKVLVSNSCQDAYAALAKMTIR